MRNELKALFSATKTMLNAFTGFTQAPKQAQPVQPAQDEPVLLIDQEEDLVIDMSLLPQIEADLLARINAGEDINPFKDWEVKDETYLDFTSEEWKALTETPTLLDTL